MMYEVPELTEFPTVDRLNAELAQVAADHPDVVTLRRAGTSRLGDPIHALRIGDGAKQALVFGGIHPNEPVGGLTALHLARMLAKDRDLRARLGFTWHIIGCIDPDGTRLNEGWFPGPFTRNHYGRHFYRPPGHEQVEWTFPFAYKEAYFDRVLPETLALMRLIDELRPALMCSLHNTEFGGIYYYVTNTSPRLVEQLHGIPAALGLPLRTGEPEAPFLTQLAPAIFASMRAEEEYDFAERLGLDTRAGMVGMSSAGYADKYGTFTLVSEVPYWAHKDSDDLALTDETYAQVLRWRSEGSRHASETLEATLAAVAADLTVDSPFLRTCRRFIPSMAELARQEAIRADQPENQRLATVAERFSNAVAVYESRMRLSGMLLRALDAELAVGNGTPAIRQQRAALDEVYDAWVAEADQATPGETIPIGSLVAVQYGAILASAAHVLE